jgi:hypothetical protein
VIVWLLLLSSGLSEKYEEDARQMVGMFEAKRRALKRIGLQ